MRWTGKKPDLSYFRVFGSTSYVHVQKDQRKGLQSHTRKAIFIGYPAEYKGWIFWDLENQRELISNTAEFDERCFPGNSRSLVDLTPAQSRLQPVDTIIAPLDLVEPEDQVGVRQEFVPQPLPAQAPLRAPTPPGPAPAVAPPVLPPPPRRYPLRQPSPPSSLRFLT